jgi:hypothetical protein
MQSGLFLKESLERGNLDFLLRRGRVSGNRFGAVGKVSL